MNLSKLMGLVLLTSFAAYAQSTKAPCISRCEEIFGAGNSKCFHMCQNYKENVSAPSRKKNDKSDEASASTSTSTSSSANSTAEPKPPSNAKKEPAEVVIKEAHQSN